MVSEKDEKENTLFLQVDQYIQSGDVTIINFWQENVFLRQLPRHSCPEAQIYKYISNNAPKRARWTSAKVWGEITLPIALQNLSYISGYQFLSLEVQ